MQDTTGYMEEEFIIWNSKLGIRDFVTIGRVEVESNNTNAWLDEPYEMVGPFSLDELYRCGEIHFAACAVISLEKWEEDQASLRNEAYKNHCKAQEQLNKDINRHNKKRRAFKADPGCLSEKEHRELLSLPLEGLLEVSRIKAAFRKIAKTAHPDVGGSHEKFVKITRARDILLGN